MLTHIPVAPGIVPSSHPNGDASYTPAAGTYGAEPASRLKDTRPGIEARGGLLLGLNR